MILYKKVFMLAVAVLAFMNLLVLLLLSVYSIYAAPRPLLSWDEAYAKADRLLSRMSLEQKVDITTGVGWASGPCIGNTYAIHNPDFPSLCMNDGPLGIRFGTLSSSGVAGINAAASFDKAAIRQRGAYMGNEFRRKGIHAQLGPSMNMIRVPNGGRGWEGFGEDPFLSGVAAAETIRGIQSEGVMAVAKHIVGNEQERNRLTQSTEMDERTLREVYAWPFARSVEADVASVMCSYNRFRGIYACENDHLLNKVLKVDMGFKGFIQSDWSATHSTVASVNGGLDMTMPGDIQFYSKDSYFGRNLTGAIRTGHVSEGRVDDMARRIVAAWYKLGQDEGFPETNINVFHPDKDKNVNVQDNHYELIRQMGAASTVVLRNTDDILPLQPQLGKMAILGSDVGPDPQGLNACENRGCCRGTLAQGWGSGTTEYPYLVTPLEGIQKRAPASTKITWSFDDWNLDSAAKIASESDIAIVFSRADSGEEFITVDGNTGDRKNLSLWDNGDELIKAVADVNKNTIVVIHSVGAVLMPWIDHPNIKAIVWPGLPGQESGNALADILFGDVNPSARLPYTIAKNEADYPARISYGSEAGYKFAIYAEGIFIGHRWFDSKNIKPLFEFGFGLSYTKFVYSNLQVQSGETQASAVVTVKNVGARDGDEVVQAYLEFPEYVGEPPKILRGFEKVFLKKDKETNIQFLFGPTELSYWAGESWIIPKGQFTLHIGSSSRDIRLSQNFIIH